MPQAGSSLIALQDPSRGVDRFGITATMSGRTGRRILIVDDDAEGREALRALLEAYKISIDNHSGRVS